VRWCPVCESYDCDEDSEQNEQIDSFADQLNSYLENRKATRQRG